MKPIKTVFTSLLLTILVLCTAGCNNNTEPVLINEDIYTPALEVILLQENLSMDINIDKTLTVGTNSFKEKHTSKVTLQDLASEEMKGMISDTVQLGDFQLQSEAIYCADHLYLTLDSSAFSGPSTQEDFMSKIPPVKLIDPSLYGSITAVYSSNQTTLSFTQPTAAENWAAPEGSSLVDAVGTAVLTSDGKLESAAYKITYSHSNFQYQLKVNVSYQAREQSPIELPDPSVYTPLEDAYAPYYLEQTYGYLQQAKHLQAQLTENIFSEVDPLYYDRWITIDRSGNDATVQTQVELTDHSRGGQVSSYTQTETFQDGNYSIITDGTESDEGFRIDSQDMNLYCTKLLTSNVLSAAYVTDAVCEIQDNTLIFRYSAGEALAETVCQKSCETIYQNPAFLDNMSESYDDYRVEYCLTIDRHSGLPLSSGLDFSGIHCVEGINYMLTARYEQAYIFLIQ